MADGNPLDGLKGFLEEFGATLAQTLKANLDMAFIVDTIN